MGCENYINPQEPSLPAPPVESGLTSVGLTLPSDIFDVANSPLTADGEIAVTLKEQTPRKVLISDGGEMSSVPSFRTLGIADVNLLAEALLDKLEEADLKTINGESLVGVGDIVISGGGGLSYTKIIADQTAAVNNGYICNKASLLTLTLPASATVGDQLSVVGFGAGLWKIAQPASVQINFGAFNTTAGTGGYIQANHIKDSVQLLYTDTNLWQVISSVGNAILVV